MNTDTRRDIFCIIMSAEVVYIFFIDQKQYREFLGLFGRIRKAVSFGTEKSTRKGNNICDFALLPAGKEIQSVLRALGAKIL